MIWSIRERRAFEQLVRRGSRVRTTTLWCTYALDPTASPPRVAFSIGRAVGPAVVRNRVRRRLRAIVTQLELPPGWWLIGARPTVRKHTFVTLQGEVRSLMEQAR